MMKKLVIVILLFSILVTSIGCSAASPLREDIYYTDIYGDTATFDTFVGDVTGDCSGSVSKTDFDAKGDILSATADDTPSILSVGGDGLTLVADSASPEGIKWGAVAGMGDVIGPAGATDTAITLYDGVTGKLVRDSLVTVDGAGIIYTPADVNTDSDINAGNDVNVTNDLDVTGNTTLTDVYADRLAIGGHWLEDWDNRVKLTIDNTDIDAALTDFPILVYLSTSSGRNSEDLSFIFDELTADANRKKIAITTDDGITQCYVEIEKWDDASEKAWLWVKVPTVDDAVDTDLYLYYDVDHADNDTYVGDTNDVVAENVWVNGEVFVSHMWDDPDNQHIRDSTSYDNDGTKGAAGGPAEAAPIVTGGNQRFDGNDYINEDIIVNDLAATTKGTWMTWIKLDDAIPVGISTPISFGDGDAVELIRLLVLTNGKLKAQLYAAGASKWDVTTDAVVFSDGVYAHIALIQDGTSPVILVNGVAVPQTFTVITDKTVWFAGCAGIDNGRIGCSNYNNNGNVHFLTNGNTALTKLINTNLTVPWITATYESERDDLLDFGTEEVWDLGDLTMAGDLDVGGTSTFNDQVTLVGDAIVWEDIGIPVTAVKLSGTKPPTWTAYKLSEVLGFSDQAIEGNEEQIFFSLQLPHSYLEGSDICPHVHWVPEDNTGGNVRWLLTYTWANVDAVFPAATTDSINAACSVVTDTHVLSSFTAIDGTGKTISSMLLCSLKRNSSNALDTYDGKSPYFIGVDFHYQRDSLGSYSELVK